MTSKFLPRRLSPWQVHIVSCFVRGEERQICLVRAHHLLLQQEHLTLADFLPLKYSTDNWTCQESDSPFTNLYAEPTALPRLRQMLIESFSNYWNDFLYNNDPIERPEILKKRIGVSRCVKIAMIVLVCTLKELTRYDFFSIFAADFLLKCVSKKKNSNKLRILTLRILIFSVILTVDNAESQKG